MPVTESASSTVNDTRQLVMPSSVTLTGPLVAFAGTVTATLVSLQELSNALTALNWTVLLPWLPPKPEPLRVTDPPCSAAGGVRLVMTGLITVETMSERRGMEFTVTTTGLVPEAAVVGTRALICRARRRVIDVANGALKL